LRMAEEETLPLARRSMLVAAATGYFAVGTRTADAHCLTQACLEKLSDPLTDAPTPSSTPKLPESAYIRLKNGQNVCRIYLGLLQLSPKTSKVSSDAEEYWESSKDGVLRAINQAVDMGYTTFDLADVYGEAEDYVGAYHAAYGFDDKVTFNTKWIPTGTSPKNLTVVTAAVDRARARMRFVQSHPGTYNKACS